MFNVGKKIWEIRWKVSVFNVILIININLYNYNIKFINLFNFGLRK